MNTAIGLAVTIACTPHSISLEQAETLVLATPNIITSVSERGAQPFFEDIERKKEGWIFDVKSWDTCPTEPTC